MEPADHEINSFLTPMHSHLREQVRRFAEEEIRPRIADMEQARTVDHKLSRLIAQQGWIGVTVGREYGGMAMGHRAKTVIIEELARVSGAMGAMVQASQLGVAKILHFGNDEQRSRWLPLIAAGACLPTIATTELESGSNVLGMKATAERDGDSYILHGRKVFVGNSHVGDLHGVIVRTGDGSRGLSAFLVEADRPGLTVSPQRPAMGLHGFSFGELVFDNCRVPRENLLGEEGDGLEVAYSSSVLYGRPNLTAVSLGIHRALVEDTARFAQTLGRYGGALSDLATVKQKLGEMRSQLMTARILAYHAVCLLDQGMPCDPALMNAKLFNVESSLDSARTAMEVHAAHGLGTDQPIERYVRDAHHIYAPAGTSDIQRLRLAEELLGTAGPQWSVRLRARLVMSDAPVAARRAV